ncbi:MAG: NUDIX domain-containing protein [Bacilli bacterium]|nr:NUDIX domain-containing protein [Bacilli bacterium]
MEIFKTKHVGCYGVVYNNNKEILLIRKSRGAYKGLLDLPGGGIEYGERPEETLEREFQEEIGLNIKSYKIKTAITNYVVWNLDETHAEDLQHIAIIYDVELEKSDLEKIKRDSDGLDSLGAEWYDVDKLKIEDLSPLAKVIKD